MLEHNIDTRFEAITWDSDSLVTAYRNSHDWTNMILILAIISEADGSIEKSKHVTQNKLTWGATYILVDSS